MDVAIGITVGAVVVILAILISIGCRGVGPFSFLRSIIGNGKKYDLDSVTPRKDSPLAGKNICFLGSSVTCGTASKNLSFVEYLSKRNNFTYVKEAVGGTTLVDNDNTSYVARLKRLDKNINFDLFVCQLSTNDASKKMPTGTPSDVNPDTVLGAVNYIISYVKETWRCPVVFFTNPRYENAEYQKMVEGLFPFAADKKIAVIDLYSNADFNNITKEERKLYMADAVHPTRAGYLLWWTPEMEKTLYSLF